MTSGAPRGRPRPTPRAKSHWSWGPPPWRRQPFWRGRSRGRNHTGDTFDSFLMPKTMWARFPRPIMKPTTKLLHQIAVYLPWIQAFRKLKILISHSANCDGIESHSRVHVTEFTFPISIVRRFPSFSADIDIGVIHKRSCSSLQCVD